jgi:hypothetical protein
VGQKLLLNTMLKAKLIKRGIPELSPIVTVDGFQAVGILDSNDLSFSRYNHLKSFVYCVWNIEHLSNIFC